MLSVLIPIYNFDVRTLVFGLYTQLTAAEIAFEILCYDDASTSSALQTQNRAVLKTFSNVRYVELPQNIGRARIRNLLATDAQYPYLLFLDCDSKIVSQSYIKNYINHLAYDIVLYGGRCYSPTPPTLPNLRLHWCYGSKREAITAQQRTHHPYHAFMTNNFLIHKDIFEKIRFDERLARYGHEDTIFGWELQQRQVKILHLDNPLEHLGLETTDIFLEKTRQGIQNLIWLQQHYPQVRTKLLQVYNAVAKYKLKPLIHLTLSILELLLVRNLYSKRPSLWALDAYKLLLLLRGST